ncbi:glycosyltransferase family 39 protein [Candidatus Falkowbacteria bacterium]|nr:glycosyltransferase family 39 protein [Candidatus Falkowbacteria bacterium]
MKNKLLLTIIALAFIIRLVPMFFLSYPVENDAPQYRDLGISLAEHLQYSRDGINPSIERPPGYPVFLAVLYKFFGQGKQMVIFFQVLLSTLTVWLTFWLSRLLTGKDKTALWAAALVALYPLFIYYNLFLYSETYAVVLFLLSLIFLLKGAKSNDRRMFFWSGLAFVFFFLTKPIFAPAGALYVAFVWLALPRGAALKSLALFMLPIVLVWGAWIGRNYKAFGTPLPFGVGLGPVLFGGNYPEFKAVWPGYDVVTKIAPPGNMSQIEYDAYLKSLAFKSIKENPGTTAKLFAYKAGKFLSTVRDFKEMVMFRGGSKNAFLLDVVFPILFQAYKYSKIILSLLFLAGSALVLRRFKDKESHPMILVATVSAFSLLAHSMLYVDERYHLTTFPLHVILAIYAFELIRNKYKNETINTDPSV